MYKVIAHKDGKVIRTRHFTTKKKAEQYEDDQYKHNIIAGLCDFEIVRED